MVNIISYILLGLTSGIISGIIGIGGGVIIIPALIYLFKLNQHHAQGTTTALLVPPIGLLAALVYYKYGYVNLTIAISICLGFFIGGFIGASIACKLPTDILRRIFGIILFLISIHMIFFK